jgi:hypothetical protein
MSASKLQPKTICLICADDPNPVNQKSIKNDQAGHLVHGSSRSPKLLIEFLAAEKQ